MTTPDLGPSTGTSAVRGRADVDPDQQWYRWAYTLRVIPQPWDRLAIGTMTKPALTVIGAWLVLAWNRFGPQALLNPRALTRFALVGLYSWLGLALGLWVVAGLRRWAAESRRPRADDGLTFVRLTGLAHQPLLATSFLILVFQLIPVIQVRTVVAFVAVVLWMPAQMIALMASLERRTWQQVALTTLLVWSAWLSTAGWYLFQRLSHVI